MNPLLEQLAFVSVCGNERPMPELLSIPENQRQIDGSPSFV